MSLVTLPTKLLDSTETIWLDRAKFEEEYYKFLEKTIIKPIEVLSIDERFSKVIQRLDVREHANEELSSDNRVVELEKRNKFLEERVKSLEAELARKSN
ncbi:hypothetical protein LOD99_13457 [Oopsacas minuta]|uniref:Uncharacterized protein n=1 Tax=Oopsacas minuta TaxID=111878 RepID=A0AAV7KNK3_9METZ|nr:hypothetical protein LOD99_13457 [Oopsacas minuta]